MYIVVLNYIAFVGWLIRIVSAMLTEIEESIARSSLLEDFRMIELPHLLAKCIELMELLVTILLPVKPLYLCSWHTLLKSVLKAILIFNLKHCKVEGNKDHHSKVVKILQDIFELVTSDMMTSGFRFGVFKLYSILKISSLGAHHRFTTIHVIMQDTGVARFIPTDWHGLRWFF